MKFIVQTVQTLLLMLSAVVALAETPTDIPPAAPAITGKVMINATTPMRHGIVLLYNQSLGPPPSRDRYWRVPDLISGTDEAGRFHIAVSPGTYYLQIAQKNPDGEIGPPKESEFFYFHGDRQGHPIPLAVGDAPLDLGTLKAYRFTPAMVQRSSKGITSIEGVVVDQAGRPVDKALVFAYLSEETMGRPTFITERTDKSGRFLLRVHDGGTFYLRVRSVYGGGAPQEGEFNNITNEFNPAVVEIKKGQKLKGMTLKVKRFTRGGAKGYQGGAPAEKVWKNIGDLQAQ